MMPQFGHPEILVLELIPLALLAWIWKRSGREVAVPVDHTGVKPGKFWWRLIGIFESMPALLLAVVIIILAGPRSQGAPKNKRALTNIEFCVDVSGSMTSSFGDGTRYEASMNAINEFVKYREGDAFGLTFFSDATLQWVPLTTDTSAFQYALPFMDPRRKLPKGLGGGTQIGKALEACRRTLADREEGDRMIILISDGYSADLGGGRAAEIAKDLNKHGIVLFDVHIAEGEVPAEIVEIVYGTDGEAFQPGDDEALAAVFKRVDEMKKAKMIKVAAESRDDFKPAAICGLSLLGVAMLGLLGMRYTPW